MVYSALVPVCFIPISKGINTFCFILLINDLFRIYSSLLYTDNLFPFVFIWLFIHLLIYSSMSTCPFVYLYLCLPLSISTCPYDYLYLYLSLPVSMCCFFYVYLYICVAFLCLPICMSTILYVMSNYVPVKLSISLTFFLSDCLPI